MSQILRKSLTACDAWPAPPPAPRMKSRPPRARTSASASAIASMASASRASEIAATSRRYWAAKAPVRWNLGWASAATYTSDVPGSRARGSVPPRAGRPAHRRGRRHRRPRRRRRRRPARARRPGAGHRPRPRPPCGPRAARGAARAAARPARPGCGAELAAAARRGARRRASTASCSPPGAWSRSARPGRSTSPSSARPSTSTWSGPLRVVQACAPLLDAAPAPVAGPLLGRRRDRRLPALLGLRPGQGRHGAPGREPRRRGAALAGQRRGARASSRPASTRPRSPPTATTSAPTGRRPSAACATPPRPRSPPSLVAFLLSDEAAGISGRLISAVWDPWRERGRPRRPARPERLRAAAAHRRPALPRPPGRALSAQR